MRKGKQAHRCEEKVSSSQQLREVSTNPEIHVLAVDDSTVDRKVIERLLKINACKVTTVDSGSRALEVLGANEGHSHLSINAFKVNLIITDYCMPGMTGFDLLKRVKETASLKEIPVVLMSSEKVPNRIDKCLAEGAEDFLIKPVQSADIQRLKYHIDVSLSRSNESSRSNTCEKRKKSSRDCSARGSGRRIRLRGVAVA